MQTMYDGVDGSPSNKLLNLINSSATSITLDSASNLPAAPNIATIGDSATAEVILYTGKSGSTLTGVTRGFGGTTAQSWAANTPVYRAFTKYDYDAIKLNINTIGDATSTNLLINGGFDVWQRGTSFSSGYTADRWRIDFNGSGATRVITRQAFTVGQTEVHNNPTYYLRFNQSVAGSGGTYNALGQRVEDVSRLSGKTVTLSFYAKADSARNITTQVDQNFGSGGSSTVYVGEVTHSLTTAWQLFTRTVTLPSVSGKTIGASNYSSIHFLMPLNATFTIDIANVQLNYGSVALPFVPRILADELRLCKRYSLASTMGNGLIARMAFYTINYVVFVIPPSVEMRANPSLIGVANTDIVVNNTSGAPTTGFSFSFVATPAGIYITATKSSHGLTDAMLTFSASGGLDAEL